MSEDFITAKERLANPYRSIVEDYVYGISTLFVVMYLVVILTN